MLGLRDFGVYNGILKPTAECRPETTAGAPDQSSSPLEGDGVAIGNLPPIEEPLTNELIIKN